MFGALIATAADSWVSEGILWQLTDPNVDAIVRVERLKDYFQELGPLAPVVYVLFVTIEVVVAPIPGVMLYAPGGIIFGPVTGGALALAGNVAGAGIACMVTRTIGANWLTVFLDSKGINHAQRTIESKGVWLIFLLRLNPLTSSDIVSYAAGFTRIPVWKVMLATGCGMAPLCFAQAWMADSLLSQFPQLMTPLVVLCGIYVGIVIFVLRRMLKQAAQK